jgi:Sec-independent protein translocase protein (TatC)
MSLLEEINKSEFVGHLKDLKTLLFKLVISWGLGSVIATIYQKQIFDFLVGPVSRNNLSLHFLSPSDSLMFVIKIVMLSNIIATPCLLLLAVYQTRAQAYRNQVFCFLLLGHLDSKYCSNNLRLALNDTYVAQLANQFYSSWNCSIINSQ